MVFDVSERKSFEDIKTHWHEDAKNGVKPETLIYLVGNCTDVEEA